jgi:predicted DNA binding CopG/RHH family protein
MRRIRLTRQEKAIEEGIARGEYLKVSNAEFSRIAEAVAGRRKDAILHIRVNSEDLNSIKARAQKLGIKYQSFISEFLHRLALNKF